MQGRAADEDMVAIEGPARGQRRAARRRRCAGRGHARARRAGGTGCGTCRPVGRPLNRRRRHVVYRVSLRNPVFATMIMLAFLVLGGFALQRLQVDQFPKIDFPTVVVSTAYPGAAPEIVESEVTRKIEEGVNTIAGINALTSRSYEGQSVVIVEFQLHIDGRKAADDVREGRRDAPASLRDEVEEPACSASTRRAGRSGRSQSCPMRAGDAPNAVELTNWASRCSRSGSRTCAASAPSRSRARAGARCNIEAAAGWPGSLRRHAQSGGRHAQTQREPGPAGRCAALARARACGADRGARGATAAARTPDRRAPQRPAGLPGPGRDVVDGAQELDSLALFNGQRTLLLDVQKAQDENTIGVVDGLNAVLGEIRPKSRPASGSSRSATAGRPIRVAVDNVRRTLLEARC